VEAKFGVGPQRIVDYLALVGDTVDGVPGVEKCGPKTAVKWLQAHGSLDGVIAHAGEISGVVGENLRRHLDFLPLGRELVTVRCDIALPMALEDLAAQPPDTDGLRDIYSRYEMRSALAGLEGGSKAADSAMLAGEGDGAASLSGRGAVPVRGPARMAVTPAPSQANAPSRHRARRWWPTRPSSRQGSWTTGSAASLGTSRLRSTPRPPALIR
ncbi:MAG: hypothetical protein EBV57_07490, partial [Betaproteobacteria bacterium]|nr:hypothetical protein [Betaproteobacteria bacterium]